MRRYKDNDYTEILTWWVAQTGEQIPESFIPKIGFIVDNTAAGFLITTDTPCCFIEPFVANPDVEFNTRAKALKEIMSELVSESKRLGFSCVYGISTSPTMLDRAKDLGFKELGKHTVLIKEIK